MTMKELTSKDIVDFFETAIIVPIVSWWNDQTKRERTILERSKV